MKNDINNRWIPENAVECKFTTVNAVTYSFINRKGQRQVVGYAGKAVKPSFNYVFRSDDQATSYITRWIDGLLAKHEEQERRAAERKAFKTTLAVGDIVDAAWGYEQTNVDFYQVVAVKGNSVTLREIASEVVKVTGDMSDVVVAAKDKFIGAPFVKRVTPGDCVKFESYKHGFKWDGRPQHRSSYA